MNTIKKILLFTAVVSVFSCKKELDIAPTDVFDETKAYLSVDDLQRGLNTAYARVAPESKIMANAACSDEVRFGPDNAGQFQFEYRLQYGSDGVSAGSTDDMWGSNYGMVDQINRVLEAFPNVPSVGATDDARKNTIRGQLLALRAYAHFELLQAYSKKYGASETGVPIMTISDLLGQPARKSSGEVIGQIENDLATARGLLTAPTAATFNDLFINQITVDAISARVALYKGDFAAAKTAATNVINSAVRPLVSGATFAGIWTDANLSSEVLFRLKRGGQSVGANFTTTTNQVYLSPSNKLTALYAASDVRGTAYIATVGGKRVVNKYYTSAAGARINDIKEIRTAEMYLIRAEAAARRNTGTDFADATADLNTLRAARITGYVPAAFPDQATLMAAVMEERLKELCFEGHRFYDLKRNGMDMQRLASDVDSPNWQSLSASSHRFVFPIPGSEILANPNCVQNPNY
ncbi:MAG: RagB/SusD family nutrient uptake outer membrane protein [Dinghuibacter sp.]|nr:RagB/SusD family nutrient uptake outer membrane protein [Dinghuibacter sp.]